MISYLQQYKDKSNRLKKKMFHTYALDHKKNKTVYIYAGSSVTRYFRAPDIATLIGTSGLGNGT